jgi:hypothetical protein
MPWAARAGCAATRRVSGLLGGLAPRTAVTQNRSRVGLDTSGERGDLWVEH